MRLLNIVSLRLPLKKRDAPASSRPRFATHRGSDGSWTIFTHPWTRFLVLLGTARVADAQRVLRLDAEEPFHGYCPPSWRLAARKAALSCDSARSIASAPCASRRSAAARKSGCAAGTVGAGRVSWVS